MKLRRLIRKGFLFISFANDKNGKVFVCFPEIYFLFKEQQP